MPQPCKVYVIDDDDAVRGSVRSLLDAFGFDVQAFPSGEEFLHHQRDLQRGIVVLDWRMPGCGGAGVLQQLRAGFFAIVHSAHLDDATVTEARRLGAHETIEKPSQPLHLVDAVRRGMEQCGGQKR